MNKNAWKENANCIDYDTNLFFDKYEEDITLRPAIDELCSICPDARECYANGVSQKEWGVWGGIYLEGGSVSREFNRHRSKQLWAEKWQSLVVDSK